MRPLQGARGATRSHARAHSLKLVPQLLGLFAHENAGACCRVIDPALSSSAVCPADIGLAVINLFSELTDADVLEEDDATDKFITALVGGAPAEQRGTDRPCRSITGWARSWSTWSGQRQRRGAACVRVSDPRAARQAE